MCVCVCSSCSLYFVTHTSDSCLFVYVCIRVNTNALNTITLGSYLTVTNEEIVCKKQSPILIQLHHAIFSIDSLTVSKTNKPTIHHHCMSLMLQRLKRDWHVPDRYQLLSRLKYFLYSLRFIFDCINDCHLRYIHIFLIYSMRILVLN